MEVQIYNGKINIKFLEGNHSYYVDGKRVQSVSSIVNQLENPALTSWKLNCAGDYLNDLLNKGIQINQSHIEESKKYHETISNEAKEIGIKVHDYCEKFAISCINKQDLPEIPKDIDDKIVSGINAFLEWYSNNNIEFLETEKIVYSKNLNYVGKFDLLCRINGILTLVDYKTSKGIYNNQEWQLCGYSIAYKEEFGNIPLQLLLLHFDKDSGQFTPHIVEEQDKKEQIFSTMAKLKNLLKANEIKNEANKL